ncbi:MAG: glycosyltransferase [Bacteroidota bacterium]
MKIAVLTHSFGLPTETFIYNEVCELNRQVALSLLTCQRYNPERFPFDKVKVIPYTQGRIRGKTLWELRKRDWHYSFYSPVYASVLRSSIEKINPSLIHAHFGPEAIRFWDNLTLNPKIPFLISFHGYDASRMLRSKSYVRKIKQLVKQPNVSIICVSTYMQRQLAGVGISSPRTHILYYGTDCDFFTPKETAATKDVYRFLQISSFREKKGHRYTLEAYARFREKHPALKTQMILAGEGPLMPEIRAQVAALGLEQVVEFPGLVTPQQAKSLLQEAHCFVHHSVRSNTGDQEGIPNAIMEAMAMQLPILATRHAGIPELVESGVNGYLVEEKDIKAYAKRMFDITTWEKQALNRQKVLQSFERRQHAQSLIKIYQKSIASI